MTKKIIYMLPLTLLLLLLTLGKVKPAQGFSLNELIQDDVVEVIGLGTGKKYKFKGMAIDSNREYGYFGSWNQKEVVKINLKEKKRYTLNTPYNGKLNAMGTCIRNGKLYAVMNEVNDHINTKALSVLAVFDLESGQLVKTYEVKGDANGRNHFNHVVIDQKGIAYISNTLKSSIYTVDTEDTNAKLKSFLEDSKLSMIHGLDLSSDETKLFCTSYSGGIKIIDLKKKAIFPYSNPGESQNDGLIYDNGFLYGVGGNAITRYKLNNEETQIVKTEIILKDHAVFNDPRCLQVIQGDLYCLANIEIDPVTFRRADKKARLEALDDTHILRIKLIRS